MKEERRIPILAIVVFYVIAVACRYITEYTALSVYLGNQYYEILTGLGPAIGALVALRSFGLQMSLTLKGNFKSLVTPLIVYWILPILFLSISDFLTMGKVTIVSVLLVLIYGLCEEIGWRGFLWPALKSMPKGWRVLCITILWYCWHLNFGLDTSHFVFFGILLIGSLGLGFVADRTYSLLALAAFHSLNNFYANPNMCQILVMITLTIAWVITIVIFKKNELISPNDSKL